MSSKTSNKARLISITGMDGVGKSTLIESLAAKIPDSRLADIWDLLASPISSLPFQNKRQIDNFLCALTPDSRLLFLAHALTWSIDTAMQSEAKTILFNGYYYKYFASELALGANLPLVSCLAARFPKPDLVIRLELDIAEAVNRKQVLSRYECGLAKKPSLEVFIDHQKQILKQWEHFSSERWQVLDASKSPDTILAEATELIEKL